MASVLGLPEPKCEIIIKSIIHILKAYVMPYSKQPKNFKFSNICHFPSEARQKNWPKAGSFVGRSAFTADTFSKTVPLDKKSSQ